MQNIGIVVSREAIMGNIYYKNKARNKEVVGFRKKLKKKDNKKILSRENYREYIGSNQWQKVRRKKLKKEKGVCVVCSGKARQVHHWKYPTHWGCEKDREIDVVCGYCHRLIHSEAPLLLKDIKHSKTCRIPKKKTEVIETIRRICLDQELNPEYLKTMGN